jgi:hypothetical protein
MLTCLRHDSFIRCNHKGNQVYAVDAGEHVPYKPFVTRHIDEPDAYVTEIEVGKAKVDRDAASLLIRQSIRIDPRQRVNKRALAVIDMTSRANDD